jgi:two-component system LytT family sensor kinase
VVLVGDELVVRNPIRPRTTAAKSTGFGLDSIIKRYAALTSRPVVVRTVEGHFEVSVPLLQRDEDTDR